MCVGVCVCSHDGIQNIAAVSFLVMLASDATGASVDLRPRDLTFKDLILHFAEANVPAPDTLGAAALLFHVDPETENSYCREET